MFKKKLVWIKQKMGDTLKFFLIYFLFPYRNNFILLDVFRKARNNKVNLNYVNLVNNLGDSISPIICNYMLNQKNMDINVDICGKKHLYAIGSVLTSGIQDCTVWGSGVLNARVLYRLKNRKFDIRAIRGPVTREILHDFGYHNVPDVYGDPAILLPEIITPIENCLPSKKYGIVFHFYEAADKAKYLNSSTSKNIELKLIDIGISDVQEFVNQITSVKIVISQSLHGIIIAESYGIPAILLKPNRSFIKYLDWYYSTGRLIFPIAESVEQALSLEPPPLPNLSEMRLALKNSFPFDIFSIGDGEIQ